MDEFWIARYPITNTQYQALIEDGGYQNERWWPDLVRPKPEPSRWTQGNRPRTDVNWYERVAFCRWLTRLRDGLRDGTSKSWKATLSEPLSEHRNQPERRAGPSASAARWRSQTRRT